MRGEEGRRMRKEGGGVSQTGQGLPKGMGGLEESQKKLCVR